MRNLLWLKEEKMKSGYCHHGVLFGLIGSAGDFGFLSGADISYTGILVVILFLT